MKKILISCTVAAMGALLFNSCQTAGGALLTQPSASTGQTGTQQAAGNLLQDLLGSLLNNAVKLNEEALAGTWTYASPECRFESENALAQAGGSMAAATVEEKLAETYSRIGIKPGTCKFTFGKDNSCTLDFDGRTINGRYTLDAANNEISFVSATGLVKFNGKIYLTTSGIAMLFDANKLLTMAQTISALTGQSNQTIGALSQLLGQYKGMMVGMNLSK